MQFKLEALREMLCNVDWHIIHIAIGTRGACLRTLDFSKVSLIMGYS